MRKKVLFYIISSILLALLVHIPFVGLAIYFNEIENLSLAARLVYPQNLFHTRYVLSYFILTYLITLFAIFYYSINRIAKNYDRSFNIIKCLTIISIPIILLVGIERITTFRINQEKVRENNRTEQLLNDSKNIFEVTSKYIEYTEDEIFDQQRQLTLRAIFTLNIKQDLSEEQFNSIYDISIDSNKISYIEDCEVIIKSEIEEWIVDDIYDEKDYNTQLKEGEYILTYSVNYLDSRYMTTSNSGFPTPEILDPTQIKEPHCTSESYKQFIGKNFQIKDKNGNLIYETIIENIQTQ